MVYSWIKGTGLAVSEGQQSSDSKYLAVAAGVGWGEGYGEHFLHTLPTHGPEEKALPFSLSLRLWGLWHDRADGNSTDSLRTSSFPHKHLREWLKRRQDLFWFVASEVSAHRQLAPLFLALGKAEHPGDRVRRGDGCLSHGGQEAKRKKMALRTR